MMVSTHYNELKNMHTIQEGIENGHVEFDERTLKTNVSTSYWRSR